MTNKVDILAIGAHPDDVELGCAGTLLRHREQGACIAVVDLTSGQLGSRGNPELRLREADVSSKILGLTDRINLGWEDGFFEETEENLIQLVAAIRYFRPRVVLCNAPSDRHPDHGRAGKLTSRACYLSGLVKIATEWKGEPQEAWRPEAVYHYIQDYWLHPDLVVDVTSQFETKMRSIAAFSSQFYSPDSKDEVETPISGKDFIDFVKARAREMGRIIGVEYGEGLVKERAVGVKNLLDLA